jgi:signal transduction histidine kinase/ActR/RegA family two-component response regulator
MDTEQLLFWLHAVSDFAIGLSYLAISATLFVLYRRIRRHLPFQWVVPAFGLFIVACGGTHIMHVLLSLDLPVLAPAALIQGLTLGASIATAAALPPLVPKVVALFDEARTSKRRKAQLEASQIEKLRALGHLASGVAHDLNQSLGIIAGYSDLVARALGQPNPDLASVRENLELIARAATDGGDTVKRLLTFARGGSDAEPEHVNVSLLLGEVAKLTAPQWRDAAQHDSRHIDLQVEVDRHISIWGWPGSLREAITNLVLNAVDALPRGGTIRLAARPVGDMVEVSVSDTGVGIPAEVQARIFEPFFTTKGERGTGLGLAMAFGIVERHGGTIAVTSAPGRGTTFTLRLPTQLSSGPTLAQPSADAARKTLRILAVDDEPALVNLVASLLRSDGHTLAAVTTGEAALEQLANAPFDLIVSDLGLGAGISGWDLAARVHATWPTTRFILATGWGAEIDPDEARTKGVDLVLPKPYRAAQLRQTVARVIGLDRTEPVSAPVVASHAA